MNIKPNKPASVSTYFKERAASVHHSKGWYLWAQNLKKGEPDTLIGEGATIAEAVDAGKKYLAEHHPDRHL